MRNPRYSLFARRWRATTPQPHADKGIRDWIAKNVDQTTADEIRIQYGGSANAKNAPELSAFPDIDGFLVGGASLPPEFADIVTAIENVLVGGGPKTPDIGGQAGTSDLGDAIVGAL